ncbi:hypothetical protein [Brasilonema bromeliae]|uniref:Small multi-drug export protein n=1 Tax=Brasilonema bromeliae SPC951 TaxID=385972 RepID=A0ABX1PDE3_9CYAN|nr:hypothetical protein [Brasilonema bromeliae]NMG22485.1 hypothetical protein [Brasilonema bromeliae SPC951]
MMDYISKAFLVWFLGFFPASEIFVAVPSGIALGLDYCSTVVWSVTGSYIAILLIHYGYEFFSQIPQVKTWLDHFSSQRFKNWIDIYGIGFVLLITPLLGVWVMSVTMKVFKMDSGRFLVYSFISVVISAVALTALTYTGIDLATNGYKMITSIAG